MASVRSGCFLAYGSPPRNFGTGDSHAPNRSQKFSYAQILAISNSNRERFELIVIRIIAVSAAISSLFNKFTGEFGCDYTDVFPFQIVRSNFVAVCHRCVWCHNPWPFLEIARKTFSCARCPPILNSDAGP